MSSDNLIQSIFWSKYYPNHQKNAVYHSVCLEMLWIITLQQKGFKITSEYEPSHRYMLQP